MKAKMVAFIILAVLLALVTTPVYAQNTPALPHAFYGAVEINGSPAPAGTSVEARGEGVMTGIGNNPIVTDIEGEYGGGDDPLAPKLIVQGNIAEGVTVTFYVNGFSTGQAAQWHSGELTEVDLAVTIEEGAVPEEPSETTEPPPEPAPAPTPEPAPGPAPEPAPAPTPELAPEPAPEEAAPAPLLPPPPPAGPGSWPVLWMVIGGVVVVGLIIFFVVARLRAY